MVLLIWIRHPTVLMHHHLGTKASSA